MNDIYFKDRSLDNRSKEIVLFSETAIAGECDEYIAHCSQYANEYQKPLPNILVNLIKEYIEKNRNNGIYEDQIDFLKDKLQRTIKTIDGHIDNYRSLGKPSLATVKTI